MILYPAQIRLLRMGRPIGMCNGGGESDSSSSNQTATNTNAVSTDRRAVASDEAVSLTGEYGTVNRNTTTNTAFTDASSTSTSTAFTDNSDHSTSFSDSRSTSTVFTDSSKNNVGNSSFAVTTNNITTTDYGAISGALDGITSVTTKAIGKSGDVAMEALHSLNQYGDVSLKMLTQGFDLARSAGANFEHTANDVLGYASKQSELTNAAFATAKGSLDMSKVITYAVLAVGAVGVAVALKK